MSAFAQKMIDILNYGALNLALGIGYKLRIFDRLADLNRPLTSRRLAAETGLNVRYLEEWLGIMVTGGVLELEPDEGSAGGDRYFLPPDRAAVLTRQAGPDNLGVYAQEIPLLTVSALTGVEKGFATGQGVPFSAYPEFQAFMAELAEAKHEETLIQDFLPAVDNGRLVKRLHRGIRVCDLGCGQGVALRLMAEAYPRSEFMGLDNHAGALEAAGRAAGERSNLEFVLMDAAELVDRSELQGRFDYVTAFDAIHDQSHPLRALQGVYHLLRPAGLFSMVDIKAGSRPGDNLDHPLGPFLYTVSLMHCLPVGLNDDGRGLGMMWGREKAVELLQEAGFSQIEVLDIPRDGFNLHFLGKK